MVDRKHWCSVMLIVTGEDLDPDEVTEILGMPPFQAWRRGDRNSFAKPDGSIHYFESTCEEGGWKYELPDKYRKDRPLQEQLRFWLFILQKHSDAVRSLTSRGWEVELDCFAQSSEILVLDHLSLRDLAGLGINLALTLRGFSSARDGGEDRRPSDSL